MARKKIADLNVSVGFETTEAQKDAKNFEKDIKGLDRQLKNTTRTEDRLENQQKELNRMMKAGEVSSKQYEKMQTKLDYRMVQSKKQMDRMTDSVKKHHKAQTGLGKTIAGLKKFGMTGGLAGLIGGAGIGMGISAFKSTVNDIDTLIKLSQNLGMSVNNLRAYSLMAEEAGVSTSNLTQALKAMQRRLGEASFGKGEAVPALERLGLSIDFLMKQNPAERFQTLAKAHNSVAAEAQRMALADKLFSEAGRNMLVMFKGADDLAAYRGEMKALGLEIEGTGKKFANANDAMAKMGQAWKGLKESVVGYFADSGIFDWYNREINMQSTLLQIEQKRKSVREGWATLGPPSPYNPTNPYYNPNSQGGGSQSIYGGEGTTTGPKTGPNTGGGIGSFFSAVFDYYGGSQREALRNAELTLEILQEQTKQQRKMREEIENENPSANNWPWGASYAPVEVAGNYKDARGSLDKLQNLIWDQVMKDMPDSSEKELESEYYKRTAGVGLDNTDSVKAYFGKALDSWQQHILGRTANQGMMGPQNPENWGYHSSGQAMGPFQPDYDKAFATSSFSGPQIPEWLKAQRDAAEQASEEQKKLWKQQDIEDGNRLIELGKERQAEFEKEQKKAAQFAGASRPSTNFQANSVAEFEFRKEKELQRENQRAANKREEERKVHAEQETDRILEGLRLLGLSNEEIQGDLGFEAIE